MHATLNFFFLNCENIQKGSKNNCASNTAKTKEPRVLQPPLRKYVRLSDSAPENPTVITSTPPANCLNVTNNACDIKSNSTIAFSSAFSYHCPRRRTNNKTKHESDSNQPLPPLESILGIPIPRPQQQQQLPSPKMMHTSSASSASGPSLTTATSSLAGTVTSASAAAATTQTSVPQVSETTVTTGTQQQKLSSTSSASILPLPSSLLLCISPDYSHCQTLSSISSFMSPVELTSESPASSSSSFYSPQPSQLYSHSPTQHQHQQISPTLLPHSSSSMIQSPIKAETSAATTATASSVVTEVLSPQQRTSPMAIPTLQLDPKLAPTSSSNEKEKKCEHSEAATAQHLSPSKTVVQAMAEEYRWILQQHSSYDVSQERVRRIGTKSYGIASAELEGLIAAYLKQAVPLRAEALGVSADALSVEFAYALMEGSEYMEERHSGILILSAWLQSKSLQSQQPLTTPSSPPPPQSTATISSSSSNDSCIEMFEAIEGLLGGKCCWDWVTCDALAFRVVAPLAAVNPAVFSAVFGWRLVQGSPWKLRCCCTTFIKFARCREMGPAVAEVCAGCIRNSCGAACVQSAVGWLLCEFYACATLIAKPSSSNSSECNDDLKTLRKNLVLDFCRGNLRFIGRDLFGFIVNNFDFGLENKAALGYCYNEIHRM